mgnify:CR=1 FL=1|jgi:hypothetical protein
MGWNDHIDNDLSESLKELVSKGFVSEGSAAFDVARKIIDSGKTSLTPAEADVFEKQVVPALTALDEANLEDDVEEALGPPPSTPTDKPAS